MRAIVFDGKLEFSAGRPRPVPGPGEALVKVARAGICATDLEIAKGYMGFSGIIGHEFVGTIEEAADERFEGKRVVGEINIACGKCQYCRNNAPNHCPVRSVLGIHKKDGAFADYLTLPFKNLHPIPDNITDDEAVFIEPLAAAYEILEQVNVREDTRVCVLGDGRLGLLTAQVLSTTGCSLLVIGRHKEKLSIIEKRGIPARTSPEGLENAFDLVVDCTGSESGINTALSLTRPLGTVVLKTTLAKREAVDLNAAVIDEITIIGSRCGPFRPAIQALEEHRVDVMPLVSKVFPIEEGIQALEYASGEGAIKVLLRF